MIASMQPADWDVLNSDQKYEICDSLLQETKHRNLHLIVENKNLKNKIKNMAYEMRALREALRAEECKFNQLNEKLKAKMRERQELMVKEEELSHNVKLLQSKLENEQNQRQTLEEKMKIALPDRTSPISQRLTRVMESLRRRFRRGRNSVRDKNHSS